MCILCVIQKWSRRVATMLPWLVLPLIGLWALSQLLPPAFRFEITSPRLACVFVLLVTLFWYEILMPKLSSWRARRNARLRERKRNEAIELQKLRKTATRKCRNCLTPYRDQNPGGGKFMCSYCGHISKRPVLELPVPPGMGMSNSGIFKDLVGKGGKLWNGRSWSDHGWMCSQDWRDGGNWTGGSFASKPVNWRKNGNGLFGGDESCLAEKSYSGIVIFACKLLTSFFLSIRWLWRKIFSGNSSMEDASFNDDHSGMLSKRGECGGNFQESRSEKARRKAEEKRQARLEKELLEEEERKQREEVARLVEERRKLRDEKTGSEKDGDKALSPVKDNHSKREAEKKRHERRKERDRGSSKSNSDAEELERRVGKENDHKHDSEKKNEADSRELHKSVPDSMKGPSTDATRGSKSVPGNNVNRGSAGARYLDRMRGTLISSSKALGGTNFFGRTANSSSTVPKESKPNNAVNHAHSSAPKKDLYPPERMAGKTAINGFPVEPQPIPAPKKSWQQLFTRATPVHPSSNPSVISRPNTNMPAEVQSTQLPGQALSNQSNDRPISFGLPSPFSAYSLQKAAPSSSLGFTPAIEPIYPHLGERLPDHISEEPELFEDPCYVPDPVSLLGPVSESLENFQLDVGSSFIPDMGLEKPRITKTSGVASEISWPSPIESPLSRLRVDDKHSTFSRLPTTPRSHEKQSSPVEDGSLNDEKTWQMWGPSPLGQDGLSLIGVPAWNLNSDRSRLSKEEFVRPSTQRTMASLFTKEDPVLPSAYSPQKEFIGSVPNGGPFSPVGIANDKDPWTQKAFFPPSSNEMHFPFKREDSTQNDIFFGTPARPAPSYSFEPSPAKCWSKKDWAPGESGERAGNQPVGMPKIGELYSPQMYSHFGTENGK